MSIKNGLMLIAVLLVFSAAVPAATLTFHSNVGMYPYVYQVDSPENLAKMLCLDFHANLPLGSREMDAMYGLPTDNSDVSIRLRAAAVAYSYLDDNSSGDDGYTNQNVQQAVWKLMDPTMTVTSPLVPQLMGISLELAVSQTLINSGFFSQFTVYTPVGYSGNHAGSYQRLLSGPWDLEPPTRSEVPEPSAMLMLGAGLAAMPFIRRLRRKL